ncbi:ADP-polyphosphate phosphotransferase [Massilia sp. S19_KUP03_FR1]|uniref:ADP-polyphosphate phosphotransferase n=1 Tax=Massilia sp. S19_KUP03_FR1 TaxID=3025503 RepID=UPI002FCD9700
MKIDADVFRVQEGNTVDLGLWHTRTDPLCISGKQYHKRLKDHVKQLSALQRMLYASNQHALLLVFQAMDTAGKDGAIRHVMSGINPQGCQVCSFQHPSPRELQHDFLWRTTRDLPERGRIGIFNRSYYEEVLIVRVHDSLLQAEAVPDAAADDAIWQGRFRSIVDMERHLHANGTRIVKVFLHLSKEEQRTRLLARIDEPDKNWKFSAADMTERACWDDYMHAYGEALAATSTTDSPWFIVPADNKHNARLIVSQIVLDALTGLQLSYPTVSEARRHELQAVRKLLSTAG